MGGKGSKPKKSSSQDTSASTSKPDKPSTEKKTEFIVRSKPREITYENAAEATFTLVANQDIYCKELSQGTTTTKLIKKAEKGKAIGLGSKFDVKEQSTGSSERVFTVFEPNSKLSFSQVRTQDGVSSTSYIDFIIEPVEGEGKENTITLVVQFRQPASPAEIAEAERTLLGSLGMTFDSVARNIGRLVTSGIVKVPADPR